MGVPSHNHPVVNFCLLPGWEIHLLQIFLVLVATIARAASCDPPPSGIVGWWPAEGNANDIIGTNNGTLMGGATASATGVVGSAFQFDGTNGYVQIPDSPVLHPTNLTVECWVLFRTLNTPANNTYPGQDYIVFKQNSRATEFEGIALEKDRYPPNTGTNDTFCWETASASGTLVFLESVTTIKTNVWYFVAGVRGSNYIQLYVNGKLEAQATVSFPQDYGSLPLYFGTSGQSYYDCKFGGLLDEVSLYNRALSSNEIAAIYAAGSAGKCRGLLSSSTALILSTHLATYGASVTFTSTVTGSGTTPTGTVAFMDGANPLGTGLLNGSGVATFSTNKVSVAGSPHLIKAVYGGDVNYAGSTSGPISLSITAATVTPGVTVSNKIYDGTIAATISNRTLIGVISGDDVNLGTSGSASFSDKNAGTNKTVTVTGLSLSGTTAGNYQLVSTSTTATASIFVQPLTITATANTKVYDSTTNAAAVPVISSGSLQGTDTASFTEAYDTRHAGTNKTLTPYGAVNDGSGGNDYGYTFVSGANGTIAAQPLTITAAPNTKPYDGTTNAAAVPVISSGSLQGTDTASFTETYDTRNVGTNKTLTPYGAVNDGNNGSNYSYTFASSTNGTITASALEVTAVANTKSYDGTTTAMALPVITSGGLQSTDTASFMETYDTKDVGSGKTLTPGGPINDGNGGNNYQVTYTSTNTGIINPITLTVTADNKTRWFGAANPVLTAQFSGFVAGETTNVLSGNPGLSTTATPGSPPGGYPINVSTGTLSATNYTFSFVSGTLTVLALPQLSIDGMSGNSFIFSFPTVSGQSYQVEYNSNLVSGIWIPLGGIINGGGNPVIITNDMNDPEGYFRLNLQP